MTLAPSSCTWSRYLSLSIESDENNKFALLIIWGRSVENFIGKSNSTYTFLHIAFDQTNNITNNKTERASTKLKVPQIQNVIKREYKKIETYLQSEHLIITSQNSTSSNPFKYKKQHGK